MFGPFARESFTRLILSVIPLVILAECPGALGQRPLRMIDGQKELGNFLSATTPDELLFEVSGKNRPMATSDLLAWGTRSPWKNNIMLRLVDGSLLAIQEPVEPTVATVGLITEFAIPDGLWIRSTLPAKVLSAIHVRLSADRERREIEATAVGTGDAAAAGSLELLNGDILTGEWVERARGLGEKSGRDSIAWRTAAGPVEVRWEQIRCLRMRRKSSASAAARIWVGLRDGSLLAAKSMVAKDEQILLELSCGVTLRAGLNDFIYELVSLEVAGPNRVYLSDVEPLSYKHVPFLSRVWPLGRDTAVSGHWLRYQGGIVTKGLGMHSTSRVAYDVSEGYERFESDLALDESAGEHGSVVFRVYLDEGAGKWTMAYESPIVRGGDRALTISIPIAQAQRLALIVDSADLGDIQDHANWLYARLVRHPGR